MAKRTITVIFQGEGMPSDNYILETLSPAFKKAITEDKFMSKKGSNPPAPCSREERPPPPPPPPPGRTIKEGEQPSRPLPKNSARAQAGKFKGYALVFDKNGKLKVDDYDKLSPEMKKIVDDYRREHEPDHEGK